MTALSSQRYDKSTAKLLNENKFFEWKYFFLNETKVFEWKQVSQMKIRCSNKIIEIIDYKIIE